MSDAAAALPADPANPSGPAEPEHRFRPPAWQRNLVFGTIIATIVAGWVGDALWASLVDRSPVVLIALNAKPRYLLLTVNQLHPWVYYPFATFRLLATKPLVWLVGSWYGPRAMQWAERRSERGGRVVRWAERHFGRYGSLIIFITSNNVVCLLAGSSGYPLAWFMVLAVVGTMLRLWLIDLLGEAFTRPIDQFIGWVGDHRLPIVALSITVVVVGIWWERRSGGSEFDEFAELEAAMEDQDWSGADGDRTEGGS